MKRTTSSRRRYMRQPHAKAIVSQPPHDLHSRRCRCVSSRDCECGTSKRSDRGCPGCSASRRSSPMLEAVCGRLPSTGRSTSWSAPTGRQLTENGRLRGCSESETPPGRPNADEGAATSGQPANQSDVAPEGSERANDYGRGEVSLYLISLLNSWRCSGVSCDHSRLPIRNSLGRSLPLFSMYS